MAKKPRRYNRRAEKLIGFLVDEGMNRGQAIETLKRVARAFVEGCQPRKVARLY